MAHSAMALSSHKYQESASIVYNNNALVNSRELARLPTQHTLLATRGSVPNPSTNAVNNPFKYCSLITASGKISHILPIVHAPVSLTITLESFRVSINMGRACSTKGFNLVGSGPSKTEPVNRNIVM